MDIFTDGSSLGNSRTSKAGWACYWPKYKLLRSGFLIGTNNVAELRAIDYALWYTKTKLIEEAFIVKNVTIFTDSQYAIDVITGKKKSHVNLDLLERIKSHTEELAANEIRVAYAHVRGHADCEENNIVDTEARRRATKGE